MIKLKPKYTLLALAILASTNAHSEVRINGFANLVGGITSTDDSLYGYDDRFDFDAQSLFAIQISGDINERMTATGQIVARGIDGYTPEFEWAYISYEASDDLSVSAGRLRLPLFRYSASLDVGYSYHWVVAPQSVYAVPFNNIDGVRVDYSNYSGDLEYTFQLSTGTIQNEFALAGETGDLSIDNVMVFTGDFAYNSWKFRGVLGTGKTSFDVAALNPALDQLSAISPDLGGLVAAEDDTAIFYGTSIEYDAFSWFVSAEYTGVEIEDSLYPDEVNYYVTAGIRSGKWTPFFTYEKSDLNNPPKFLEGVSAFPEPLQVPLTQLIAGVQLPLIDESSTSTLGVRYEYDTNVAFKADITQQQNDITDEKDNLLRFAVNYVF